MDSIKSINYVKNSSTKLLESIMMHNPNLSKKNLIDIKKILDKRYNKKHNKDFKKKNNIKTLKKYK